MTLRTDAIRTLSAWAAPSPDQAGRRAEYLEFLAGHEDGMLRTCLPGHVTASALVVDRQRGAVLLTLHPKVGRWLQLGGHCESSDESLAAAALREATEESGITGLVLSGEPARLDRHPVRCRPDGESLHFDVQYVALAPADATVTISDESLDLSWWPVNALPPDTDASVRALVRSAAAFVD